ncbi:uncharacterized protein [Clinocottus analis]|uniref:uncharacterized protein n=1 Tax=Clinocottus analis TaxID=304258 RepID=UPI0035C0FA0F
MLVRSFEQNMDSMSNNSEGPGKQPSSSLLNVFSNIFNRDRNASSDAESAVLTSFKELSDEDNSLPEGGQTTNSENNFQGKGDLHQDNVTASCDLVQVIRVETYIENEQSVDEEEAHSSTSLSKPTLPEEDINTLEHGDGDEIKDAAEAEYQVPVFRTHKFTERSRIEAILYSNKFVSRSNANSFLASIGSKKAGGRSLKESTATAPLVVSTSGAGENSKEEVRINKDEEFAGIDGSLPVTSIFSRHLDLEASGHNAATASPLKEDLDNTQREEIHEIKVEADEGAEEPPSSQVSSSVPSDTKTPEVSALSVSSPEEQSESDGITNHPPGTKQPMLLSSAPEESAGDIQPGNSPSSQSTTSTKTPEKDTPPPASSTAPSSPKSPSTAPSSTSQVTAPSSTSSPSTAPSSSSSPSTAPSFTSPSTAPSSTSQFTAPSSTLSPSIAPSSTSSPSTAPSSTSSPSTAPSSSPSRGTALSSPPSFQMPALFSGLRVLKKGALGDDRETVSEIKQSEKDADLALLSLKKTVNKAKLLPEQKTATSPAKKQAESKPIAETKSTVMGHLSQLLNLDNHDETTKPEVAQDGDPEHHRKESENGEEVLLSPDTPTSPKERKKTSDLAYETFRNLFGPKTVKKEKAEVVDLDAVKKKIKNDKENLRSIFERTSKSPGKELNSAAEVNV